MAWRQALRSVGVLVVAWPILGMWPSVAVAADTVAFTIKDKRIVQSSGLARDTAANLYWTVNGSGQGRAYGLTAKGKVSGSLNFRIRPQDVEAVALVKDRLYVGDIGDNSAKRNQITIYYFDHPRANGLTVSYHSWDFRYPDGAHDAETLLVSSSGRLSIVTKGAKGAVYQAPRKPSAKGVNKLTRIGPAPAAVTDGVFLPGDKQIALLSHSSITVVDATTYQQVAQAAVPQQPQADSLAVSLDDKSLLVGSSGKLSKVYSVPMPRSESATPSPSSSASTDPGGDSTDDPGAEADANSGESRQGTFLALGLAAFVAVVAGLVVGLARKPSP